MNYGQHMIVLKAETVTASLPLVKRMACLPINRMIALRSGAHYGLGKNQRGGVG